ncbi:type 11 methyltransferase [Haloarcula marismortui ATCC 33799]|uniref:Type 11 methyltransferase n=2 Tax=Haloarcula marismortui TaxID=2238 RepID=M0K274_9EURY|nr:type 11 methyltransferase [Haloarcula californiae ATCC 33799]
MGFPKSASNWHWDREYARHTAIPSSGRDNPSKALIAAQSQLDYESVDVAVDIGCGNGRNAVYLAEKGINVIAIDFSTEAVARTRERIAQSSVSGSVEVLLADITHGCPITADSIDLVIDSYFSCHLIEENVLQNYFDEVRRILSPDGQLYWSGLGVEDEYYQSISNSHPAENVIVDPLNDIPKKLYDSADLDVQLPVAKVPSLTMELLFEDDVAGNSYKRSIISAVFNN